MWHGSLVNGALVDSDRRVPGTIHRETSTRYLPAMMSGSTSINGGLRSRLLDSDVMALVVASTVPIVGIVAFDLSVLGLLALYGSNLEFCVSGLSSGRRLPVDQWSETVTRYFWAPSMRGGPLSRCLGPTPIFD